MTGRAMPGNDGRRALFWLWGFSFMGGAGRVEAACAAVNDELGELYSSKNF